MSAILDLNDNALKLRYDGQTVASPGYAWFDGQHYQFGAPALATRRRTPRSVNARYWSQLDTQPLTPVLGPARHHADLAHDHLQTLHRMVGAPTSVLAAVPGCMSREQLSLLLGIVEALPFHIAGLVHRTAALAAASGVVDGVHIELQLQQVVLTPFSTEQGFVTVGQSQRLPGQGLLAVFDRLANVISQRFIEQTRFDPLRSADSEQALYDQLPALLDALQHQSESTLALEGYNARIVHDDLTVAGYELTQKIHGLVDADACLLLENPLPAIPGLQLPQRHQTIDSEQLLSVIHEQLDELQQTPEQLHLNKRVRRSRIADNDPEPAPATTAQSLPSHILIGHTAHTLSNQLDLGNGIAFDLTKEGVVISADEASHIMVNGHPVKPGQSVKAGDVIGDNLGLHATLIIVES